MSLPRRPAKREIPNITPKLIYSMVRGLTERNHRDRSPKVPDDPLRRALLGGRARVGSQAWPLRHPLPISRAQARLRLHLPNRIQR